MRKLTNFSLVIIEVNEFEKGLFDMPRILNMLRLPSDGADASAVLEN